MIKNIIFIIILFHISSEIIQEIKDGEDIKYDKYNNKFKLKVSAEDGDLLFYIITDIQNTTVTIDFDTIRKIVLEPFYPGNGMIFNSKKEGNIEINLSADGKEEGTIWIFPLSKNINIDFSENYGKMFPSILDLNPSRATEIYSLNYTVSKLPKEHNVIFNYLSEIQILQYKYDVANPFRICHKNECIDDVVSYIFKENEEYTIHVKFQNIIFQSQITKILTGYSFYDKN